MPYNRVSIFGSGSWGTTVGSLIARNASALIWGRNSDTIDEINQRHTNSRYLGEIPISKKLAATTDLRNAAKQADALVLACLLYTSDAADE